MYKPMVIFRSVLALFVGGLVLLFGSTSASAQIEQKPDKGIKARLQGEWQLSSAKIGGRIFPASVISSTKLTITKEGYTVVTQTGTDSGDLKIMTETDDTNKHMRMDVIGTEGPNKGKKFPAIFKFDDKGNLHICYDLSEKARPADYESPSGSLIFLAVYKKAKPSK